MSTGFRIGFSPTAQGHLRSIRHYIAGAADADTADRYIARIVDHCMGLADFPRRGTPRDDLSPGLRTIVWRRRTTIAYLIDGSAVIITGVFRGGQDFERLLRDDW